MRKFTRELNHVETRSESVRNNSPLFSLFCYLQVFEAKVLFEQQIQKRAFLQS